MRVRVVVIDSATRWLLVAYSILIVISSLSGGLIPSLIRLNHHRMQMMISVVGGFMLGVGALHQLPHALTIARQGGLGIDWCAQWLLAGVLITFFLMRLFHSHAHFDPHPPSKGSEHEAGAEDSPVHARDCDHHHPASASASWLGLFLGLSVHTLLDGIALAAHVAADASHVGETNGIWLLGIGTLAGVAIHKPLDSLSITAMMAARGWSIRERHLVNAGYALMCPCGVVLFYLGVHQIPGHYEQIVSAAMSAAAGVFICIALADLLPEIEFHSHDRLLFSSLMLFGVLGAWGIGFLEPAHAHSDGHDHSAVEMHDGQADENVHSHAHPSRQ